MCRCGFSTLRQRILPYLERTLMILDPRLEESSSFICNLHLCQVRLSHNAAFPWILLIPRKDGCIELTDLNSSEHQQLIQEINLATKVMQSLYIPDKINIATLGNVVPQMHIHVIARYTTDPAWPNPVWNTVSENYTLELLEKEIQRIGKALQAYLI